MRLDRMAFTLLAGGIGLSLVNLLGVWLWDRPLGWRPTGAALMILVGVLLYAVDTVRRLRQREE